MRVVDAAQKLGIDRLNTGFCLPTLTPTLTCTSYWAFMTIIINRASEHSHPIWGLLKNCLCLSLNIERYFLLGYIALGILQQSLSGVVVNSASKPL